MFISGADPLQKKSLKDPLIQNGRASPEYKKQK
jgi:hypothetical protein